MERVCTLDIGDLMHNIKTAFVGRSQIFLMESGCANRRSIILGHSLGRNASTTFPHFYIESRRIFAMRRFGSLGGTYSTRHSFVYDIRSGIIIFSYMAALPFVEARPLRISLIGLPTLLLSLFKHGTYYILSKDSTVIIVKKVSQIYCLQFLIVTLECEHFPKLDLGIAGPRLHLSLPSTTTIRISTVQGRAFY